MLKKLDFFSLGEVNGSIWMGLGGGLFQFKTFGNMHHPSRLAYLGRIFGEQNYSNCGQFYGKYLGRTLGIWDWGSLQ